MNRFYHPGEFQPRHCIVLCVHVFHEKDSSIVDEPAQQSTDSQRAGILGRLFKKKAVTESNRRTDFEKEYLYRALNLRRSSTLESEDGRHMICIQGHKKAVDAAIQAAFDLLIYARAGTIGGHQVKVYGSITYCKEQQYYMEISKASRDYARSSSEHGINGHILIDNECYKIIKRRPPGIYYIGPSPLIASVAPFGILNSIYLPDFPNVNQGARSMENHDQISLNDPLFDIIDIKEHVFEAAFSFAGEHRSFVEMVARNFQGIAGKNTCFYDNDYTAQLSRPSLDLILQDIYRSRSKLVVVFLCSNYEKKMWCGIEWNAIRVLIAERKDRVMFVRMEEGEVSGVLPTDGYLDVKGRSALDVAHEIFKRVILIRRQESEA